MIYIKNLKKTDLNSYNIIRNIFVDKKNTVNETENHMNNFINEINIVRYGIYLYDSNIMIGYCSIGNINFTEKYCSIHIAILEKYQNKGYGKKTINILHNIIFNVYNLKFIYLTFHKNNERVIKLYNSLGYTIINYNPTENKVNHFNMINQQFLLFINKEIISKYNITFPDVYFSYEYGEACEFSDNAKWECCLYKDLMYVYLKKEIEYNGIIYYELITPYGYSGYYYKNKETYKDFINSFRIEAKKKKYISEILRQTPYLNKTITDYEIIKQKKIYSIEIDNYDNYFLSLKRTVRNKLKKALNIGLTFHYKKIEKDDLNNNSIFRKLYNNTMVKVKSTKYYYFNDKYFNKLEDLDSYIIYIKNKDETIIGSSIIFKYNNFIHYHLSGNDNSISCITDFLLLNIVKEFGLNNKIILGGGLIQDDNLSKFKEKFATRSYNYTIYKNILNEEIYQQIKKKENSS